MPTLATAAAPTSYYITILVAYASIVGLFVAGELDRHNGIHPCKISKFNLIKYPIFAISLILFSIWIILFRDQILRNIFLNVLSNPTALGLEVIIVPLVREQTCNRLKTISIFDGFVPKYCSWNF